MKEQAIQHDIIVRLRERGCYVVKVPSGAVKTERGTYMPLAPSGTPDLLVARPDKLFGALEIKTPEGDLSQIQRITFRKLDTLGLAWAVMDDVSQVDEWLNNLAYHGSPRLVTQVWTDKPEPKRKTDKPIGLGNTRYAPYKKMLDEKIEQERNDLDKTMPF